MTNLSPNRSTINYLKTGSNYTNQKTKIVRVDFKKNNSPTIQLYTIHQIQ